VNYKYEEKKRNALKSCSGECKQWFGAGAEPAANLCDKAENSSKKKAMCRGYAGKGENNGGQRKKQHGNLWGTPKPSSLWPSRQTKAVIYHAWGRKKKRDLG